MKTLVQNLLTNYKQRDNITAQSKRLRKYCASREKQNLTEVQNVNEKERKATKRKKNELKKTK